MNDDKGLLLVYTGNGKGKTTAALGLAFRAVGQGLRVGMFQFIKGSWHTGEMEAAGLLGDAFHLQTLGRGFVKKGAEPPAAEDVQLALEGWQIVATALQSGEYDLVILDEVNNAVHYGMLPLERVLADIRDRPPEMHLVCTGRNAPPALIEMADLVTEVKSVKHHYHDQGIKAQRGIEF